MFAQFHGVGADAAVSQVQPSTLRQSGQGGDERQQADGEDLHGCGHLAVGRNQAESNSISIHLLSGAFEDHATTPTTSLIKPPPC